MNPEAIKDLVKNLPEIAAWTEARAMLEGPIYRDGVSVWSYPAFAASAVGGHYEASLHGAAAILCSLISIHLVDDMLDDDPSGHYRLLGYGRAANFALVYQAAALRVLDGAPVPVEVRQQAQALVNGSNLATAFGQELDAREVRSEEEYWRVVEAKSPPLFGAALALGALLAGAPQAVVDGLLEVGRCLGRFIQVSDDLADAMKQPARADWLRPRSNLALLFALEIRHDDQGRLAELVPRVAEPEALEEAQGILLRCGAVSYCAFKLVEIAREVRRKIASTALTDAAPIQHILNANLEPLRRLLAQVDLDLGLDLDDDYDLDRAASLRDLGPPN